MEHGGDLQGDRLHHTSRRFPDFQEDNANPGKDDDEYRDIDHEDEEPDSQD